MIDHFLPLLSCKGEHYSRSRVIDFKELVRRTGALPEVSRLRHLRETPQSILLRGVEGSFLSLLAGGESLGLVDAPAQSLPSSPPLRLSVLLGSDHDEAAHLFTDLVSFCGKERVYFFPSSYRGRIDPANRLAERAVQRTETLLALTTKVGGSVFIVSYPAALAEKLTLEGADDQNSLSLAVGDKVDQDLWLEKLEALGFTQEEFVYEPGQFARRGAIVDLFSYADFYPYRVDFLGNRVDSIRRFAVDTQRSIEPMPTIQIVGPLEESPDSQSLLSSLFPSNTLLWTPEKASLFSEYARLYDEMDVELRPHFATSIEFERLFQSFSTLERGVIQVPNGVEIVTFSTFPQPVFRKNFQLIAQTLRDEASAGRLTYIFSEQDSQLERLDSIFHDHKLVRGRDYELVKTSVHQGFLAPRLGVNFFTDHELFERHHAYRLSRQLSKRDALSMSELQQLQPGDYVVHEDYGIGIFEGLISHRKDGVTYELVRLSYRDRDSLLMSVHSLDKLSKYRSSDDTPPVLNKLNSAAWGKLKARTKKQVKDIARDLIQIYAERRAKEGFAFSPDTYLQEELEASFPYEDTPDQLSTTLAVKHDMEQRVPMDRLICADVGFGKTEIAIRASFKAVTDSKQVAVLVPTTVLALQHYRTFTRRLANFPARVAMLTRLQSSREQKEILASLADGKIDIVIGTHALLRPTIKFKDLGLLVVDEEQKFGVAAKEHLKALRTHIDTLTLTATPIPRTLQFSLMGARDMSLISTPPPNRYPIETEVMPFDETRIASAIRQEIQRGGQVYFVNNLVQNLSILLRRLSDLLPEVRFGVAHGQMKGSELEQVMLEFMNGDYDVLLCTSIVEAGLDIPNVNTIFINNGQRFGLGDLHQLRGRVGRSDRKAYCYILTPGAEHLTPSAQQRLRAIVEYADLGSGMNLAMQDLNIRGAGNLLGAEQSGFVVDLGIETYYRILDEAVEELKQEEFSELFTEGGASAGSKSPGFFVPECVVDSDLPLYLPDSYVESTSERMTLYRELTKLRNESEVASFSASLVDRFGILPTEASELLRVPLLKSDAHRLGIQRIQIQNGVMALHFVTPMTSPFYKTETFSRVLRNISSVGNRAQLRQTEKALYLVVRKIEDIASARDFLGVLSQGA